MFLEPLHQIFMASAPRSQAGIHCERPLLPGHSFMSFHRHFFHARLSAPLSKRHAPSHILCVRIKSDGVENLTMVPDIGLYHFQYHYRTSSDRKDFLTVIPGLLLELCIKLVVLPRYLGL
jgi:hypothetical protein